MKRKYHEVSFVANGRAYYMVRYKVYNRQKTRKFSSINRAFEFYEYLMGRSDW